MCKGIVHAHKEATTKLMLSLRQFGVSLPGGAEALIHFRKVTEQLLQSSTVAEILAILDIDLVNAFPSFEWEAIREGLAEYMPGILPWTQWCHETSATVFLPSGGVV